ncbi:SEC-C domain-containing protein [Nakamurella flava]|uniref:SEC-C domain-containing protein n=1 Tax=Nakamurella flava TaxID=2576308 RepID=A0A4U6QA73_9ACTN|nr:DUF5926 family protein [Nakamurella flava]TKV56820.1 SEC-C domain-containing protein [Nakamurella flava]
MSKKNARRAQAGSGTATLEAPADNPRRPCSCGSGRRYKACHGSADAADLIVPRPFAGLQAETELIALREFVPSATTELTLRDGVVQTPDQAEAAEADAQSRRVLLTTVLPGAAAALTRADGTVLLGMQVQTHSGDLSRDVVAALEWALTAGPSQVLSVVGRATEGPRLQDVLVDGPLEVTVHDDFSWWLEQPAEPGSEVAASLERANQAILPTKRVADRPGAYWVDAGDRAHLRWVRPEDEAPLMAALARLAAADELGLGEGSRYVGSFRAHGRLVPVWDLDRDAHPSEWDAPALAFEERLQRALASDEPLTDAERRARDGILGRQFTLR